MVDIVNGLLLHAGQVLMARRSATRPKYPGTWSFPGGHVEPGETLDAALARELSEEIGITLVDAMPLTVLRDGDAVFHLYAVHRWTGDPQNLGDEHSQLRWIAPDAARDLPDLALASYREVFARLTP